jgi:RND family efflux transporter MFP subunit
MQTDVSSKIPASRQASAAADYLSRTVRQRPTPPETPAVAPTQKRKQLKWPSLNPAAFHYTLVAVASLGLLFGIHVVETGAKPVPIAQPVIVPSHPPFKHYIAGAGIVEAASENIQISTPIPGMVTDIPVRIGQQVNAGDLLFKIDTRDLDAELKVRHAALEVAVAKIDEMQSSLDDAQQMYDSYEAVIAKGAVTKEEFNRRRFSLIAAKSRLQQAKADVASAQAQVDQTQSDINRRMITAPITGQVIQIKIHPGEYAQVGPLATSLMVMGDTRELRIRTDIDENDAWRFSKNADAVAYVRGNPSLSAHVKYVLTEPYVIPKTSLTGNPGERVDTRVLQVLFKLDPNQLDVFVGQQMDVYVEVPTLNNPATQP